MGKISLKQKSYVCIVCCFLSIASCLMVRASEESSSTTTTQTTTSIVPKETKADLRKRIRDLEETVASRERCIKRFSDNTREHLKQLADAGYAAADAKHKISRLEAENSKLRDERDETPVEKLFNFVAKKTKRDPQ